MSTKKIAETLINKGSGYFFFILFIHFSYIALKSTIAAVLITDFCIKYCIFYRVELCY